MSASKKKLVLEITDLPDDIKPELLQRAAEETLKLAPLNNTASPMIFLHFVNPDYMRKLNKQFRDIDSSTDVLTFPLLSDCIFDGQSHYLLGEIYIDMDMIEKNAHEYGFYREKEFLFTFVHGCLHLLGFTHENEKKKEEMIALQNNILKGILHEKY